MGASPIEWTDATWNPIGGCSIHSPGCKPCYAQKLAGTRLKNHPLYAGTTDITKDGKPVFNGTLTVASDFAPVWSWPLGWRGAKNPVLGAGKPSLIFVGDMSDLFHEDRPIKHIDRVIVAGARSKHILQLLTKRADVMAGYILNMSWRRAVDHCRASDDNPCPMISRNSYNDLERLFGLKPRFSYDQDCSAWPSSRVWLGFSAERQKEFNERWPHMRKLAQAGWTIFVSYEPAIGPLVLPDEFLALGKQAQVIAGGMSGADAMPAHPQWFRDIRDQCQSAGVPFFFKQWGEWATCETINICRTHALCGLMAGEPKIEKNWPAALHFLQQTKGISGADVLARVGKKAAGRLLDGVEHDGFPEVRSCS